MADYNTIHATGARAASAVDEGLKAHMSKVYGIMATAMVITAAVAYAIGIDFAALTRGEATSIIPENLLIAMYSSPIKYIIMFAPLIVVFAFSAMINRLSENAARLFLYGFAALMGLSIAWIFAVFTQMSIAHTFFGTAAAFAGLSLYGYTTKKDLSGWGSFLIMGVIGLIVASIINIFLQSDMMSFAISAIGVLIFAGLTVYDTQNIKNTYLAMRDHPEGQAWLGKAAIMGALSLYLDFVNLFMFLLQFLGSRE